ncbi:MAG TPA: BON domain-containing protein [Acidimicrobiia bacterium]
MQVLYLAVAAAAGAAIAYLFDPDRGRSRRARLADQAAARARDTAGAVKAKAEYQKGVAKGIIHDVTEPLRGEEKFDDDTLLQKVKSEALGYWPDSHDIEVDITNGLVRVSGTVGNESDRKKLIKLIRDVEGVGLIDDRIKVGA